MLTIRLQRIGKAKHPIYRLIVSEKARDTHGMYLEHLGSYNPHQKEGGFAPRTERIQYWIGKGAGMSNTIYNLLLNSGVVQGKKKRSVYLSTKRKAKLAEKKKSQKPAAAAAPAPEAPVEAPAA